MLSSRDLMTSENQRFSMNNGVAATRQISNKSQEQEINPHNSNIPQPNNLVQGIGHLAVPSNSNVPNTMQNSSSVYNGFYSTSTFNSINNFEASLQWLTESRMPNNTLLSDKNLSCNSHTAPSHSCCMNRLGTVDNIGMCSPLSSGDSFKSSRDAVPYQTKPPALSVNIMDSVQNWFNLPPLPNQQYNNKFNDQNLNCPQMNFPLDQTTDLKQSDICLQIPDSYFEQSLNSSNNSSNKPMNGGINDLNSNKMSDVNDMSSNTKGHSSSYQTSLMSREWKQPIQTTNYLSSPTLFGSLSDSPDHYLYSIPPPVTTSSYCMVAENIGNMSSKLQQSCGIQENLDKHISINGVRSLQCIEQMNHAEINSHHELHHQNSVGHRSGKTLFEKSMHLNQINENLKMNRHSDVDTSQNCSHISKNNSSGNANNNNGKYNVETHFSERFLHNNSSNDFLNTSSGGLESKLPVLSKNSSSIEINDEITSGSEESNIIVEESDETEEIESIISIEEIKKPFISEEPVELRCLVCNVKSSLQTPATQFIHMNDTFPLTSASKTPVATKLIQILPTDLQHFLKLHNSFMCRHCLNLIETVEVLEVKLLSVKQTLSENFSKTVQCFLPATPILEIENGKAKIIDKEIVPCIEKSVDHESSFANDCNLTARDNKTKKDYAECIEVELEEIVESEDNVYDKDEDCDEESEDGNSESVEKNKESRDEENCNEDSRKQCNICSKILSSVKTYKKHMQLHTKCFSYYCEYCGKGFNLKFSLEKHIKLHVSDSNYQCEICGKTYSQKHRLESHLKKHFGAFKVSCGECGKGFMDNSSLEIHIRSHTKEQPFVCEICGSKFVKESNLKNHLRVCRKEEVKCNLCSEVFYSRTHLKKHEISNHGAKPSTECSVCGKVFVNNKDLKPHMRSHSQDKPHECKICGKRYKSVGNLNHHAKIHDGSKLLSCTLCEEVFQRRTLLEEHMNKHSGERPYKCPECGKSFFQLINMQRHLKIHSGDVKMKTCPVCGKKFHNGLEVHMRTHNGIKPYVCSHCGQAFTVNSTLTRHIQSKHPNVLET